MQDFLGDSLVKNLPLMQETWIRSWGQEDPLEKEMATHTSILARKTPWTVSHQTPLSLGFSRQEYWSGLPFPFPGDLPDPGIEPGPESVVKSPLTMPATEFDL